MRSQGGAPKEPQASSSGFHGAICGAGDREPSAGHSCPFPACLVGLPHQETHVSMSAPQSPHEAASPLGARPLPPLAGPWCLLHCAEPGRHGTARERSWHGSRELSQCPVFALGGQAVVVHPSLLSFNVLVPAFNGRKVPFARFLVLISHCL